MNQPKQPDPAFAGTTWDDALEQVLRQSESLAPEVVGDLLEKVIAQCPTGRGKGLNATLEKIIPKLETILPDQYKSQAERFVKTAMLTMSKKGDLLECTASSIIYAVMEAGKYGFAIDGRLFHIVSRNRNVGTHEKPKWVKEAQCMPDYKGLIAAAKRANQITHADAELVHAKDTFKHGKSGGGNVLEHTWDLGKPRGNVIGAYARIWFPNGTWDYELMDLEELQHVAAKSTSFKPKKGDPSGPWITDPREMQKKTVLRRALKTLVDDPMVGAIIDMVDREYERPENPDAPLPSGTPIKPGTPANPLDALADALPPAPSELASFSQGTAAATQTKDADATPNALLQQSAQEVEDTGPTPDEYLMDQFRQAIEEADTRFAVGDVENTYRDAFGDQMLAEQAKRMIEARLEQLSPPKTQAPKGGKAKQRSLMDTHSNTGA